MDSKKINQLATNVAPSIYDLTVVGDATSGELKKITLNQIASLFGSVGGVSSVAMTVPTGLSISGSPITTSGTFALSLTAGYSIPTTAKQTEWDTGYAERLKWDGGATGLVASTARTSLGLVIGTDVLAYRTFGSAANNNTGDFATAAQGVSADTAYSLRLTGASLPLSISGNIISIAESSTTISGFLSSTNFNVFNNKQAALNGTGFVKASGTSITYDNSTYALDNAVVHYIGTETIGGTKTFSDTTKNNGGIFLQNASSNSLAGYMNLGGLTNGLRFTSGGGIANYFTLPSATGYTYTFPNATGTLALTSDLGAYLPLSGGTLTGALNGTSATFSSTGKFNSAITGGAIIFDAATNYGLIQDANSVSRIWFETTGSYRTLFDLPSAGTAFAFRTSAGTIITSITSAGAATFSSTLGIGGVADSVKGGTYTPTASAFLNCSSVSASNGKYIRVGNIVNVTMDATATFSSTFAAFYVSIPVGGVFTGGGYSGQGFAISTAGAVVANGPVSPEYNTTDVLCSIYVDYPSATTLNFVITFQYRVE